MRLYLIRHPRPVVADGICYGRTDLPLAAPVDEVATELRPLLPPDLPVFSSPLDRCYQLALALHPTPYVDTRLQEMHFGEWEMQAWQVLDRSALDTWAADPLGFAPPGGESPEQLQQRAIEFCTELSTDAIVVTHAGVIKALSGWVNDLLPSGWIGLSFPFGSLTLLETR